MSDRVTHVGFSDESNWNQGRFRSLGLVSTSVKNAAELEHQLTSLLSESGLGEFSWKKLDGARERFAALKLARFSIAMACAGHLRVDVVVWDIEDSRHKIFGRDDIANLHRMYYHLFRNVLRARWPAEAVWRLHPDEHTAMDWNTIRDCLSGVADRFELERSLFTEGEFRLQIRHEFGLEEGESVSSQNHPLLQLADLFAGLAVFSRDKQAEYLEWLRDNSNQPMLFDEPHDAVVASRRLKERFPVLREFYEECKRRKLGVSLRKTGGLRTPNPDNPLNFWLYEPQHVEDKAPTRASHR